MTIIASTLSAKELAFIHLVLSKTKTGNSATEQRRLDCIEKIARMRQRLIASEEAQETERQSRQTADREASVFSNPMRARGYQSSQLRSNVLKSPAKPKAGSLEFEHKQQMLKLDNEDLLKELGL